ncbi:MAG: molecular chaperone HtpG [Acidobacteriota bacterium]
MTTTVDAPETQTHAFQAETRQLLDIVIHSLYSNKEIFLRELISNASDAVDRLRFEALSNEALIGDQKDFEIRLEGDGDARTLTIADNGIGMSRQEVIDNIGTIAKSGTRELMARIRTSESAEATAELIGQFGVGFYSAFMVADRVDLVTRRAGEEIATRWSSTGDGQYTIEDASRFTRGTTITLHLKDVDRDAGLEDFTDFWIVQRIVKRYSDFVAYPIRIKHSHEEPEKDAEGNPTDNMTTVVEDKTLNSMRPIWTRSVGDVKNEEYREFYRHISNDWHEPLMPPLSLHAEGRIEYRALLFLPQKAPFDLYYREPSYGLQLYVRRVLIKDACEDLLPSYLRFVKGVVDSADLPLNVSRELVQQDRHLTQMRKWLTRKVLDHLQKLAAQEADAAESQADGDADEAAADTEGDTTYADFWNEFGRVIKEGISQDYENRDRLAKLLRFASSHDDAQQTSLDAYIARMKEGQDDIFFLTGENRAMVENSPHLEAFRAKGYEVLYLTDPVDELVTQSLTEYEGKTLKSVGKGTVDLGTEEEQKESEEQLKEKSETYSTLLNALQKKLDAHVKDVRLSNRLTTSPVCLVGAEHDMSPHFERLLRRTEGDSEMTRQRRIMELNPEHDLLGKLHARFDANADDPAIDDYAQLLLGYALLAEGSELPDPSAFNRVVAKLMVETA